MDITRKTFLKQAGAFTMGFSGLHLFAGPASGMFNISQQMVDPFGPLQYDPDGLFDLPEGFSYKIISKFKDVMDDGFYVPHRPDGMAAFEGADGLTILIRNHEVNAASGGSESAFGHDFELTDRLNPEDFYDFGKDINPGQGGTTTIIFDTKRQKIVRQYLSLAGTIRNCAGGPTPWNSWLTCEETVMKENNVFAKDHGYVFEIPAKLEPGLADPVPIKGMGRFNHEAVAVDPETGIVYQTEDEDDGLIYRFIPETPGELRKGGRLQALSLQKYDMVDTRNWEDESISVGTEFEVEWIDLDEIDNPKSDLRYRGIQKGAALFARGEGMWYGNDTVYFACTEGGVKELGQIWKYSPSGQNGGTLELFVEPNDSRLIENADNLTVAPWGDLILCEDSGNKQNLVGITPNGKIYTFAENAKSNSELAGATFSPDGTTLFMNIQHSGLTLAITGPWHKAYSG